MRLAQLVTRYGPDFLAKYQTRLRTEQQRALWALQACHTEACGRLDYQCSECPAQQQRFGSCGHRFCPACQHHHNAQWLARQEHKRLPCDYYLVTFTLPAQWRDRCRQQARDAYNVLFQAASQTLQGFAQKDRALGGKLGLTAVLHTHSRQLQYHPHVHVIVPAGCLKKASGGTLWRVKQGHYLFNNKALANVFRAKFLAHWHSLGLAQPAHSPKAWVVHCAHVGHGDKALQYLSRYLYRGVVSEQNILGVKDGQVHYRYQEAQSKEWKILQLPVAQFLWRVLQHVLPRGFRRTRDYGLLHGAATILRERIRLLSRLPLHSATEPPAPKRIQPCCKVCGQVMRLIRRTFAKAWWEGIPTT